MGYVGCGVRKYGAADALLGIWVCLDDHGDNDLQQLSDIRFCFISEKTLIFLTPKVAPPPPRRAQNKSGFLFSFAVTKRPSESTTS
jgi:hypothetical protein